ncbi:MAG: helix-turn-helix transcriptional regulator [Oscillospiraceae bacterium]|nr:helix-turn-helix transcriptional regulator [Oscillospiraceae bacterium]
MSKFHLRLRDLRKSRELSQQELANNLQISKSSVNMYERGEREPGLDTLEAIADFFNVDMDYLTGKTSEIKSLTSVPITDYETSLKSDEKRLLGIYRGFNNEGKEKLLDTALDMSELNRYKK